MQPTEKKYRAVLLQANCDCDHPYRGFLESVWRNAADEAKVLEDIPYTIMYLASHYGRFQYEDQRIETINTLRWLAKHADILRSMLVCANPSCTTAHKYFFRENPRDQYCCDRCKEIMKEDRKMTRLIGSGKYREYKRSQLSRDKMSEAAKARWERVRGKAT